MVDLVVLQSVSYTAGAISVVLGIIYYAINLRETNKNRRITTTTTLVQSLLTIEMLNIEGELYQMTWKDFEDFRSKYDSSVNIDNFSKRMKLWGMYEVIGTLYKSGLLNMQSLFCVTSFSIVNIWIKFKPIIEEYRKISYGRDGYKNWEYVAHEVARFIDKTDPLWRSNAAEFFSPEEYDRTFKLGAS
ncbi:MAG: hypothetical protein NTY03_03470 [Candidatus Bathyarchaeota archaeon]|nr:hypothetical protein [Candidatus Bathyarchaeota archaeon]